MDDNKLLEACFSLSEELMWNKDTTELERLPEHIEEVSIMTTTFFNIAMKHSYLIEDLPDAQEVLLGAIGYLKSIAIPPLKGNFDWFSYSLTMLLEIANPNDSVGASGLPFLFRMRNGVEQLIAWANMPES